MTDRQRLTDVPGSELIKKDWVKTGYGDMIPLTDAYLGVNTDALIHTAQNLYGIPAQHDNEGPTDNTDPDPRLEVPGGGKVFTELSELSRDIERDMGNILANWHGPAFEKAFQRSMQLADAVDQEAHDSRRIGQALVAFALALEDGQRDVTAAIAGTAELSIGAYGLATASGPLGISLAVTGVVLSAVGKSVDEYQRFQEVVGLAGNAAEQLGRLITPGYDLENFPKPSRHTKDWEVEKY